MSVVRVLVVEDFEPFRRFIASTLQTQQHLQIVCEVADGVDAVHKAEELQPELILLDIGLPSLNGIEAARQIRKLSPNSRIVFLSQESAADAVQEALGLGAMGYVVKVHAGTELLPAMQAALQGERFVSSGLSGYLFNAPTHFHAGDEALAPAPPGALPKQESTSHSHGVRFYPDDESLVAGFADIVETALEAGSSAVVVATEAHRSGLLRLLQQHGLDCGAAIEEGRYVPLDVDRTLATFMDRGLPDPLRFSTVAGDVIRAAANAAKTDRPNVVICGECAALLWERGMADAAIGVEYLCDELARTGNVDVFCGYVATRFSPEQEQNIYVRICAGHSAIHPR